MKKMCAYVGMALAVLIVHDAYAAQRKYQRRSQLKEWISREEVHRLNAALGDKDAHVAGIVQYAAGRYALVVNYSDVGDVPGQIDQLVKKCGKTFVGVAGCQAMLMIVASGVVAPMMKVGLGLGCASLLSVIAWQSAANKINQWDDYARKYHLYQDPDIAKFYTLHGMRKKIEATHWLMDFGAMGHHVVYQAIKRVGSKDIPLSHIIKLSTKKSADVEERSEA